jgi:hypothetical protein
LLKASIGVALACGLGAVSAQAAPASSNLMGAKSAGEPVQAVHYNGYRDGGRWGYQERRWYNNDWKKRRWWWWKNRHARDRNDRGSSWNGNDRRYDNRGSRRDW